MAKAIGGVSAGAQIRGPLHPRFIFKAAGNMGGLRGLLSEAIRNSIFHGLAQNVYIEVRTARRSVELSIIDDGNGIEEAGRECFGEGLGYTTAVGTGSGGRLAAAALCQVLEAITVPASEPKVAYRLTLHLPSFIVGIANGTWKASWEPVPRAETPFPAHLKSGTMLLYRDFRASDNDEPLNERKMRDTSHVIRVDGVRRLVPTVLPPDLARRVLVDGSRVQPPEIEGFPLWTMRPKQVPGLGTVSGDIRYAPETEGCWCTIGGTTATVPMQNFVSDCREHHSRLAARIPTELVDRRNAGFIRIEVLERFPTQSRERLDPAFYETPEAAAVVEFLATIVGPELQSRRAEYDSRPATEATRASILRLAARMCQAQGVAPGVASGGGGAPVRPEDAPLELNRVTIRLEVARGRGIADTGTFRVLNPLPDETFAWDDHEEGLLEQSSGDRVVCRAGRKAGVFSVDVQSDQHPHRRRTLSVDIHGPEREDKDTEFLLVPMQTTIVVGDEKAIAVRSEGPSSGEYKWTAVIRRGSRSVLVDAYSVQSGARQIIFRPTERGDYVVTCTDTRNSGLVATSNVEVLAQPAALPAEEAAGGGTGEEVGGTGVRRSSVSPSEIHLPYHGTDFRIRGVPYLKRLWALEPDNRLILIADGHPASSGARSPEERDHHIAWCIAAAIAAYQVYTGALTSEDTEGMSRLHDEALRYMLVPAVTAKSAPPSQEGMKAGRRTATRAGAQAT